MPVGLGPRFLIEAGFIIAVAIVVGVERFRTLTIVLAVGGAWLLVALVEGFIAGARRRAASKRAAAFVAAPPRISVPEAEVVPATEPPEPMPSQPRLAVVPPPPPEPEPEPEIARRPEPEPEPAVVSRASRMPRPREWNLWDLERLARDRAGGDVVRDEERSYLLMYLREFAHADGALPADFDAVVRESFGDVLDGALS